MKSHLTDLIAIDDFTSLKHKLVVYNLTSNTEILKPEIYRLSYLSPTHLSFQAPKKLAALGHQLELLLFPDSIERASYSRLSLANESDLLVLKGRVEIIQDLAVEGVSDFLLKLEFFDRERYEQFVALYSQRQERLDQVLERCKE